MRRKIITFLIWLFFAAVVILIGWLQYRAYHRDFSTVTPHEHDYTLSMPDRAVIYDLNEISLSELAAIPGVSKSHAAAILAKRDALGRFSDVAELDTIDGLPPSLLETLHSFLYVLPPETTAATPEPVTFPLNLNEADASALCQIPGIGEKTAAAILALRERYGRFTNRSQLLEVSGIGEKTLAEIMNYVYIPDETEPTEPPAEAPTTPASPQSVPPVETLPPEIPIMDLNTVTLETLMLLPGCTESIARQILELRDNIHYYSNPLEINYIEDITPSMYGTWEPYLFACPPTTETTPASE